MQAQPLPGDPTLGHRSFWTIFAPFRVGWSGGAIRVSRPPHDAVLTLDNPAQRNAMSDEMTASWVEAIEELAGDRDLRAVVVTGEGTAFCSGGNTGWIASEPDATVDHLRTRMITFYRAWLSIRRLEVPTVAAVNGPAIGAGLCLALTCDLRYAVQGAGLGAPFVRLGMHAGMAATYLLPHVVGEAHARDLRLTGRTVDADEALRLPTVALRDGGPADLETAVQWEALAQPLTLATADLQEGIAAAGRSARRGSRVADAADPGLMERPSASPVRRWPSPC